MRVHRISDECRDGECPAVYLDSDDGMPILQGSPVASADGMKLGDGEVALKVPLDVVLSALPALIGRA